MHVGMKGIIGGTLRVVFPLALGGAILYWMYRGFDLGGVRDVMARGMDWRWMLLSFPFGMLAQMFRGWRWRLALAPMGARPRMSTAINAVFLSYASSLVVPRMGEFLRCGVLKRYDGVPFAKALGTVVTERVIDSLVVGIVAALALITQMGAFSTFLSATGTGLGSILGGFSAAGYAVTAVCAVSALVLLHFLLRRLSFYERIRTTLGGLWEGMVSLRNVSNLPLFTLYTLAIWACYFLHYYLTFFCFGFTAGLGVQCALVTFVVGSMAVVVPTPNGAGPWHFAVKTMLILYGVAEDGALCFVLIVHAVQTLLVVLLGIYSLIALGFSRRAR